MPGLAFEDARASDDADDPRDEAEGRSRTLEHRTLLDVHLEKASGELAALDERRTPHAAALLVSKGDHCPGTDTFDRLDSRHDAECAVELAAVRNRVEVRSCPDTGLAEAADQVLRVVDFDAETRFFHPLRCEIVRSLLALAPADAVRTDAAADGVQLFEPFENARGYSPNGLNGFGLVETRTLFVSR